MTKNMSPLPASETHMGVNIFAAFFGCASIFFMQIYTPEWDMFFRTMVVVASVITPILLADIFWLKPYHHASAKITAYRDASLARIAIKTLGLYGIFFFYGLLYRLLPIYDDSFYTPFWELLSWVMPPIILATPFYIRYLDKRMDSPEDAYTHMGWVIALQWSKVDWHEIKRLLRNWLVKAFFLPLMFIYLMQNITFLSLQEWSEVAGFKEWYDILNNGVFLVDLLFACTGYIVTLRVINSQIRSSEPTFFGWVIAVMCYTPFWSGLFYREYFSYDKNGGFTLWLSEYPLLFSATGITILLLLIIYSWATVCMGYRFSNLTYRGLITSGPYRWTKHPAYVAKNLSWWLIGVPFLANDGLIEAAQNCTLLLGVNAIYFMRARTEEAHLSNYPEYVAYAEAMNERSIFAPLAKHIPYLRYRKPENPPAI